MIRRDFQALAVDVALVLLFAGLGRAEHDRGNVVLGVLDTAWPFLVGLGVGWIVVARAGKRMPIGPGPGITVWFTTVVVGMACRQITGAGTAFSFIVVATLVLGAFLFGWRVILAWSRHQARATTRSEGYSASEE